MQTEARTTCIAPRVRFLPTLGQTASQSPPAFTVLRSHADPVGQDAGQSPSAAPSRAQGADAEALAAVLQRVGLRDRDGQRTLHARCAPKLFGLALRILVRKDWRRTSSRKAWSTSGAGLWRADTSVAALVAPVAVGQNPRMAHPLGEALRVSAVAVLQNAQARAAVLAAWDAGTRLLSLKRLDATPLTADPALQRWALPVDGHPGSLAVTGRQRTVRLIVAQPLGQLQSPALAISVEPRGGSPNPEGPIGPVVLQGALIDSTL
ncbi:MAG: anti-sigma factor [Burkholderiaceae bacterium]|nr:anti-sigma factor [Burkholderiaceae bacterium]